MDFKTWLEDQAAATPDVFSGVFRILSNIPCEKEFAEIVGLVRSSGNAEQAIEQAAKAAYEEMLASLRKVFLR